MSSSLDYIGIRGLEGAEPFQGSAGGSGSTTTTTTPAATTALEWGDLPDEAISLLSEYTADINTWLQQAADYDPTAESRALLPAIPAIPEVLTTIASGALSLPATAVIILEQVLMNAIGSMLQNYADSFDENSPANIMKKAWLYKDENEEWQSILNKAMLYFTTDEQGKQIANSILGDRLADLAFVDAKIDFGFMAVYLKGKMIEKR